MTGRKLAVWLLLPYVAWLTFFYRYHFIDGVNLALHETGHLFFSFGGETLHFLGGTLGQLAFPVAFIVHFRRQQQYFESAICTLWLAESLMYTAEYLGDAKAMRLPLVGGGTHDWNWLLSRWGLLDNCVGLAQSLHLIAVAVLVVAWYKALQLQYATSPTSRRKAL